MDQSPAVKVAGWSSRTILLCHHLNGISIRLVDVSLALTRELYVQRALSFVVASLAVMAITCY
jgi:succinate dehydrogenase/fumarate reductase cytochrome b subunit